MMPVCHQLPSAFPDLPWLIRWLQSEAMILDDVSVFSRKLTVHRGKIRNRDGFQWIHMPVHPDDRKKPLHLCRTDPSGDWVTPLLRSLEYAYRNSIYFDMFEPEIREDMQHAARCERYLDAVAYLNQRMWLYLELEFLPPVMWLSERETSNENDRKPVTHPVYRQHFGGFIEGCCLYDVLFEVGPEFWKMADTFPMYISKTKKQS